MFYWFPGVCFTVLMLCCFVDVAGSKVTSRESFLNKAAKQLLEKEETLLHVDGTKCKASTDDISRLRVTGKVNEALPCLLKTLKADFSKSWNWSQLGEIYAIKGSKSKAKTCFKQAVKLGGKLSPSLLSKWHILAPFVSGKTEVDADPLEAFGGIRTVAKQRFSKKEIFYSELMPGGKISWKIYEQAPNQLLQVSPPIQWMDLVNSLGSLAITEWQGWAVAEFAVNSEKEDVAIQCLGVPAVYIDGDLLAGDVYRREFFWSSVTLHQGIHTVYVRLRAKANQVFQCKLKIMDREFIVHGPNKVPDLVDGHLISDHMPVSVTVTNLKASKWLTNIRFKPEADDAGITIDETTVTSIAPGQTAVIPFFISQTRDTTTDCTDIKFKIKMLTSAGSDEVTVPLRCRKKDESWLMTFEDHDGSIQEAAVIAPYGSCEGMECVVILTLHGTGVQAQNQADSYKRMLDEKWVFGLEQAWILAPTRHGAHNWEGPGSLTALTALKTLHEYTHGDSWPWPDGNKALKDDAIFAGHSMGGHGAWHLATHYPEMARAVISIAGWNKKEEYGDSNKFFEFDLSSSYIEPSIKAILEMCFTENDVDKLVSNLKGVPVMARIGADDRTVHPFFVRRMFRLLKEEGVDITYSELKGKDHWWWDSWETNDGGVMNDPEVRGFMNTHAISKIQHCLAGGADCSDTINPQAHLYSAPSDKEYNLTIFNPAYRGYVHGFKIVQQLIPLKRSNLQISYDNGGVHVKTSNVLTLSIDLPQVVSLEVDGSAIPLSGSPHRLSICSNASSWEVCDASVLVRTARSYGPARRVAEKPFLVVTGTQIKATRTKLLLLATYLSNLFLLTSDTMVTIIEDDQIHQSHLEDQNLIIIGNKQENRWTETFLDRIPINQSTTGFHINNCNFSSELIGVLALAPNGQGNLALLLMGSSIQGLENIIQLATPTIPPMARSPYSNMIPDFLVTGPKFRRYGPGGYECVGFWGNNWNFKQELTSCIC